MTRFFIRIFAMFVAIFAFFAIFAAFFAAIYSIFSIFSYGFYSLLIRRLPRQIGALTGLHRHISLWCNTRKRSGQR